MTEETKDPISKGRGESKLADPVTRALIRMQRLLNRIMTLVLVGFPVMFALGLGAGYYVWGGEGTSNIVQANTGGANQPVRRTNIEIYPDDPVRGPEDAPVTIIEFSDFECPYCQKYNLQTYPRIIANYGDQVRYVFKDLPLISIHPNAVPAAAAAHCANEQDAFWEYHDLLFSMELGLNPDAYLGYASRMDLDMAAFETCLNDGRYDEIVLMDTNILVKLGAQISTPTFFINGRYVSGARPYEYFAEIIEEELALAK